MPSHPIPVSRKHNLIQLNTIHMNTDNQHFSPFELSQLSVLVERHLYSELQLLERISEVNRKLTAAWKDNGPVGSQPNDSFNPAIGSPDLDEESGQLRQKRKKVLEAINRSQPEGHMRLSIRRFIRMTEPTTRVRLENIRLSILNKLNEIRATMIGNQAVFYYSFDFYKRMVSGLLQCDLDESQYRADGQSSGVKPGNLYRKAC